MYIEVTLLDGTIAKYDMDNKSTGEDLLNHMSEKLGLVEKDYFGFLYVDSRDKTLTWYVHALIRSPRQKKRKMGPTFEFRSFVQMYPPLFFEFSAADASC